MAFYGYKGDFNECLWNPSVSNFDDDYAPTPIQSSFQFSSTYHDFGESVFSSSYPSQSSLGSNYYVYNYTEPTVVQFEPIEYAYSSYCYQYENSVDHPLSTYECNEPKFLQYSPLPHDRGYFPFETIVRISYSTVGSDKIESQQEFNEPEFDEYDPTPYGGGYDPAIIYGKPLPPSDKTCFPRSVPKFDPMSLEKFSFSSNPSPYVADDGFSPTGSKVVDTKTDIDSFPVNPPTGSKAIDAKTDTDDSQVDEGDKDTSDTDTDDDEPIESLAIIPTDHEFPPSSQPGNGLENGGSGGFGYEAGQRQVSGPIPYGSGLEAMDLCESIFGYWPCLTKMERQEKARCREVWEQERRNEPWNIAADYLFGSPVVYDYEDRLHYQRVQSGYASSYGSSWMS